MSFEDNSETQIVTVENPATDDGLATDRPPLIAGEEAVPLRDPANLELDRERAERVRTVVGSPRSRWRRPGVVGDPRRSAAAAFLLLTAIGVAVVLVSGAGAGGSAETVSPAPASSKPRPASESTPRPTPPPRPHTRRRADLAADLGAGRRRVHDARGRRVADARDPGNGRDGKTRSTDAAPASSHTRIEPVETTEEESVPASVAAKPEAMSEERVPAPGSSSESAAAEPAPESTAAAPSPSSEARSPAESEFDFER